MKKIGLIGGMSWESTVVYYQLLNRFAREKMGGLHSADLLLWSFDFAHIESMQSAGNWDGATAEMIDAAKALQKGGAECFVICTNTMHKMADAVQSAVDIPLIHIADASAVAIKDKQCEKPLLLATRYTMEQDFYKGYLRERHGINVVTPDANQRTIVHDIIYNELCQGQVLDVSKAKYLQIIADAVDQIGADGVIFGCTEVGLLLSQQDMPMPAFDTTYLHAQQAIDFALNVSD